MEGHEMTRSLSELGCRNVGTCSDTPPRNPSRKTTLSEKRGFRGLVRARGVANTLRARDTRVGTFRRSDSGRGVPPVRSRP